MVTYMQSLWETWLKAGTRSIPIWLSLRLGLGRRRLGAPTGQFRVFILRVPTLDYL